MHTNYNIIGLCGRLQSGKTTLANICEKYGYERIYFALPLKQLVSQLFHMSIDEINKLKNVDSVYTLGDIDMKFLAEETDIPLHIVKETLSKINFSFKNTRQIMQFIGTDIIRAYNANWHVNKLKEMIKPFKKYVIDDIRFQNELSLIKELGGSLWYVVRPKLDNVSNHISEISIKWQDIENIIVNNTSLDDFQKKWDLFMSNGYEKSMKHRNDIMNMLRNDNKLKEKFISSNNSFNIAESMFISKYEFMYNNENVGITNNIEIINDNENQLIKLYVNDTDYKVIDNPLNIEDMKIFIK